MTSDKETFDQTEIKPCPFCGSEATIMETGRNEVSILCNGCPAKMTLTCRGEDVSYLLMNQVMLRWNTRLQAHQPEAATTSAGHNVSFDHIKAAHIESAVGAIEAFIAGGDELGIVPEDLALDALDVLACAARQSVAQPEAEAWFDAWAILDNGELNGELSGREETGIGSIHGVEFEWVREIYDNGELWCYMEQVEIDPPANAIVVNFKVSNLSAQEGQMSFPETGQWDFPPHTEMDIEVIGYDIMPPLPIDLTDPGEFNLADADVEIPF